MTDLPEISPEGLHAIEAEEGWINHVYKDPIGLPTIGYGHLIRAGETFPATITLGAGEALLRADSGKCVAAIKALVRVPLEQCQIDALGGWLFNCGAGALAGSGVLRAVNEGRPDDVPAELERWCKAKLRDGTVVTLPLLLARRRREGARWRGEYTHAPAEESGATRGLEIANPDEALAEGGVILHDLAGEVIDEMRAQAAKARDEEPAQCAARDSGRSPRH